MTQGLSRGIRGSALFRAANTAVRESDSTIALLFFWACCDKIALTNVPCCAILKKIKKGGAVMTNTIHTRICPDPHIPGFTPPMPIAPC